MMWQAGEGLICINQVKDFVGIAEREAEADSIWVSGDGEDPEQHACNQHNFSAAWQDQAGSQEGIPSWPVCSTHSRTPPTLSVLAALADLKLYKATVQCSRLSRSVPIC